MCRCLALGSHDREIRGRFKVIRSGNLLRGLQSMCRKALVMLKGHIDKLSVGDRSAKFDVAARSLIPRYLNHQCLVL